MSRARRTSARDPVGRALFGTIPRKPVPHAFVLDAIASVSPATRPMFGCLAVYVGEKIVFVLRDKPDAPAAKERPRKPERTKRTDNKTSFRGYPRDNGVWLATTKEHHASLRREFPHMRSIHVLGKDVTGWQVLPADAPDFEAAVMRACELVVAGDPRIGKVPKPRLKFARPRARNESR